MTLPFPARALALALALTLIPNCCLLGQHAHGAAMASLGPICRALR